MDYGTGVEHCARCHRPRCPSCGSCAQISQGGGPAHRGVAPGTFRRRYICTGCGARLTLDYPSGEDSRRCLAQDAAFGIGPCVGCRTRTNKQVREEFVCIACQKARRAGYADWHAYADAKYGSSWDAVLGFSR
jgi:hypothetical protein